MNKEFNTGDKVFCLMFGNGIVTESHDSLTYSVRVDFGGYDYSYTKNGCFVTGISKSILFHGHDLIVTVTEPEYEYQIIYGYDNKFYMTEEFYTSLDDCRKLLGEIDDVTVEFYPPSKQLKGTYVNGV